MATALLFLSYTANALSDNPFLVKAYGNFSTMISTGDARAHVSLQSLQNQNNLYGLGALEDLQGEVIIINGNILITPGTSNDGHIVKSSANIHATLLATSIVKSWTPIKIPSNTSQTALEVFILKKSSESGIPKDAPFPFMLEGQIKDLAWHVIDGFNFASKPDHRYYPAKKQFTNSHIKGMLLGFYSGKQLEGIISHPKERFHIHFIDSTLTHAGHVETFGIGSNATLFLPNF
jgi:alpha-acetolactate decarboxylase